VVSLAPALELDPLATDEQLAVHDPGVLVVGAGVIVGVGVVVHRRVHLPFEVETDREALADLTPVGVARLVEAHPERLQAQTPVLHRGLAHALGPKPVGAHLERVAARQRHFVVAHDDETVLGRHEVRPVPRDLLVGIQTEPDVPTGAVGA
jgi:hypothetical protein